MKRTKSMAQRIATAALILVALAIVVLGAVGWVGSERAIHPKAAHYKRTWRDFPTLHPERVTFMSRTATRIAASFVPGERKQTVILTHGYGDHQELMLPYAEFLHRQGYTVLLWDMRNRGASGGDAVTLGALESLDLQSAVDYLSTRADVDATRIGALGVSLGGSTTVLAAAADKRIRAAVDDSGFSDAPNIIETSFEHFIGLPAFPFAPITVQIASWRTGVNVRAIRPMDVAARIAPRPLLVIHCQDDTVVPPDNSERIFNAARGPKQLWRLGHGGHIGARKTETAEYERVVGDFLRAALQ